MKVKIYNVSDIRSDIAFARFHEVKKLRESAKDYKLDKSEYKCVYDGEIEAENLDDIYMALNVGVAPDGFCGHSMSISDIVEMDGELWYCDSFGWVEVHWCE